MSASERSAGWCGARARRLGWAAGRAGCTYRSRRPAFRTSCMRGQHFAQRVIARVTPKRLGVRDGSMISSARERPGREWQSRSGRGVVTRRCVRWVLGLTKLGRGADEPRARGCGWGLGQFEAGGGFGEAHSRCCAVRAWMRRERWVDGGLPRTSKLDQGVARPGRRLQRHLRSAQLVM